MVLGIQIVGCFFALFMLYVTFLHQKRKEYTVKEYLFWTGFWIVFGLISLFPRWLNPLTTVLKIGRTMDLFIILGFMFVIGMVIYVYDVTKKTQKKVDDVVRKIALEDARNAKRTGKRKL